MSLNTAFIAGRVAAACLLFAFFVLSSLKSRFRYSVRTTGTLFGVLTAFTVAVTIVFLTHDKNLSEYSGFGISLWILSAVLVFRLTIKGSYYELLFIVLVVLNLYANIMAISKIIVDALALTMTPLEDAAMALISISVMAAYAPLLWLLFTRQFKQVIEIRARLAFWNYIWLIPALTYVIFYIKIITEYWKLYEVADTSDIIFSVLWSFTTYAFFWVTLQMVIQSYRGIAAVEQAKRIASQLEMQKEQYVELTVYLEKISHLKHDWRHHLCTISGFANNGDMESLKKYLREMGPEYVAGEEIVVCENHVVNAILKHYMAIAKEAGIEIKANVSIPKYIAIEETDLGVLFGNLVENAVDACRNIDEGDRTILVKAETKGTQITAMVRNTYNEKLVVHEGVYMSTKHQGPGIGLPSVKSIVEDHQGFMKVEHDGHYFSVMVLLSVEPGGKKAERHFGT